MLRGFLLALLAVVLFSGLSWATDLRVADAQITTAIENQQPVDTVEDFPADYGKLFCFSRIVGAEGETEVTHVWYYQDNEMAKVSLPVKSANWRTYSSKRFLPQWAGRWRVSIQDAEGHELASVPFVLK